MISKSNVEVPEVERMSLAEPSKHLAGELDTDAEGAGLEGGDHRVYDRIPRVASRAGWPWDV
jgi:hypothetical protein